MFHILAFPTKVVISMARNTQLNPVGTLSAITTRDVCPVITRWSGQRSSRVVNPWVATLRVFTHIRLAEISVDPLMFRCVVRLATLPCKMISALLFRKFLSAIPTYLGLAVKWVLSPRESIFVIYVSTFLRAIIRTFFSIWENLEVAFARSTFFYNHGLHGTTR